MKYVIAILLGYLLGSLNLAYFLSLKKGVDMRKGGSGNLGTSNATILLGWRLGILVGVHDIGKALAAVWLSRLLFSETAYIGAAAGVAAVLGHIFPFYLGFKGGKGFAPFVGMTFALSWQLGLVIVVLIALATVITDYLAVGTFITVTVVPVWMGIAQKSWILSVILLVGTGVILFKHRENIGRILNGTEIGLRSTAKGEHKVK